MCPAGGSSAAAHSETLQQKKRRKIRLLGVCLLTGYLHRLPVVVIDQLNKDGRKFA